MLTIIEGDALEKLRELPDESAQCCVTSPPYWGLRDYGTATWEGGDAECDHAPPAKGADRQFKNGQGEISTGTSCTSWTYRDAMPRFCKCGAKRIDSQIGLEETPDAYVAKMVEVFREVRRVLRNDGTLWLNLGDSYSGSWSGHSMRPKGGNQREGVPGFQPLQDGRYPSRQPNVLGCKPKDLVGIPWMVAFALRADGWYLRSDIIWHKPNPMPESVTDRPTKAHEYLFLMSKQAQYFYDAEAIREKTGNESDPVEYYNSDGRRHFHENDSERGMMQYNPAFKPMTNPAGRNKRSVWTVATAPYSEAHFATYPPDLIKPCILAGSKAGDTVLDPFAGSGTTGMVAIELGRKAILIELNPTYVTLIERRCDVTMGLALMSATVESNCHNNKRKDK